MAGDGVDRQRRRTELFVIARHAVPVERQDGRGHERVRREVEGVDAAAVVAVALLARDEQAAVAGAEPLGVAVLRAEAGLVHGRARLGARPPVEFEDGPVGAEHEQAVAHAFDTLVVAGRPERDDGGYPAGLGREHVEVPVLVLDGTEVAVVHYGEGRDLDKVGGHLEPGVGLVEAVRGGRLGDGRHGGSRRGGRGESGVGGCLGTAGREGQAEAGGEERRDVHGIGG